MKISYQKPDEGSAENIVKITSEISDKRLYRLCKRYGANVLLWRRRFSGLLPEVFKRRYEKKGYGSIFEFAAKLAGMSREQVRRILNLEKRFEAIPVLREMLENGEVSVNKLARVASVATTENQEFWAAQVQNLSQSALETLVRDEKYLAGRNSAENFAEQGCGVAIDFGLQNAMAEVVPSDTDFQNQNGFLKPESDPKSVRAHGLDDEVSGSGETLSPSAEKQPSSPTVQQTLRQEELNLSPTIKQKLLDLQRKGIDINKLLTEFLEKREQEIAQTKEKLAEETKPTNSRHIPIEIRELITKEFGTKCSIAWCMREADEIHHSQRFSLTQKHDPRYLAPFCEEHHEIAHSIDLKLHAAKLKK